MFGVTSVRESMIIRALLTILICGEPALDEACDMVYERPQVKLGWIRAQLGSALT